MGRRYSIDATSTPAFAARLPVSPPRPNHRPTMKVEYDRHDQRDQQPDQRAAGDGRSRGRVAASDVRAPRAARAVRALACVDAAAGFVARLAELDVAAVRAFVHEWHRVVSADADNWFAAEAALGAAVVRSGRRVEQLVLLRAIAETFTNLVWYRRSAATPELAVGATEPSGQYAATLAMLALLVRDHLDEREFALVYAPFARLIPAEELGPG